MSQESSKAQKKQSISSQNVVETLGILLYSEKSADFEPLLSLKMVVKKIRHRKNNFVNYILSTVLSQIQTQESKIIKKKDTETTNTSNR